MSTVYDAIVIGGGLAGCGTLRALTLAGYKAALLEKAADILDGASKGNSAILHTAFDAPPQSLESRLMQEGRRLYLECREALNLPLLETDAILAAWSEEEAARLPAIIDQAERNGVRTLRPLPLPRPARAIRRWLMGWSQRCSCRANTLSIRGPRHWPMRIRRWRMGRRFIG